ncbi:MAG: alpha/beta hydrolase fold domain-containing protein [Actinomycetota bacterium]
MHIDPAWFDLTNADPETLDLNEQLEQLTIRLDNPIEVGIEPLREAREKGRGLFGPVVRSPNAVDRTIPGPNGGLTIRVFTPEQINGIYLYFHGGGWAMGAPDYQDGRLEEISRRANVAVVSVGYSLAPEHPYPAPADDAEAASRWIVANAAAEFGTDRVVLGGSSAGAHLAVTAMLRMRDRHDYTGFAGANLIYGFYDLSLTPSARNWGDRPLVMTTDLCRWFADVYANGADLTDPDVSPLYADVTGLAPALFTVGSLDPLLDDTLLMATRWSAAGNGAGLHVVPGAAHGFVGAPTKDSVEARARMDGFISERVS